MATEPFAPGHRLQPEKVPLPRLTLLSDTAVEALKAEVGDRTESTKVREIIKEYDKSV